MVANIWQRAVWELRVLDHLDRFCTLAFGNDQSRDKLGVQSWYLFQQAAIILRALNRTKDVSRLVGKYITNQGKYKSFRLFFINFLKIYLIVNYNQVFFFI
jgi:hypothetical protein